MRTCARRAPCAAAEDAIINADAAQTITFFNQAAERMFGYAADEAVGHP